jgi:hypothetical protein
MQVAHVQHRIMQVMVEPTQVVAAVEHSTNMATMDQPAVQAL